MPQTPARFLNYSINVTLTLAWIANFAALVITADAQETKPAGKPAFPASLPGRGLAQHDFLYAGEAKTRDVYIVRGGQVVWSYHDPAGRGEISDADRLSNGNILFAHQFGVTLISPDKEVLWHHDAPTQCETHTVQPIGTNHIIFIQTSSTACKSRCAWRTGTH